MKTWSHWRLALSGVVLLSEIVGALHILHSARLYAHKQVMWSPQHWRAPTLARYIPHISTVQRTTPLDMHLLVGSALARSSSLTHIKNTANSILTLGSCQEF